MTPLPMLATILYEDSRGPTRQFGLHELVVSCVSDESQQDRQALKKRLLEVPVKGAANVLRRCREEAEDLSPDGRRLIAVFDDDRIRRMLGLAPDAPEAEVVAVITTGCTLPERLSVVLLQRNLESVVKAVGDCEPSIDVSAALDKDRAARDRVLIRAAFAGADLRRCIQERVPSLRTLCQIILDLVRAEVPGQGTGP